MADERENTSWVPNPNFGQGPGQIPTTRVNPSLVPTCVRCGSPTGMCTCQNQSPRGGGGL